MNSPIKKPTTQNISLNDKYNLDQGWVYLSGSQALVRLGMLQKQRDYTSGLNTAGFISGYRGSPLGGFDQALWQAKDFLHKNDIVFHPGLNEDIAATSIWGTQQVTMYPDANRDGVFGIWYGKGPGVDRSMDVFKHANNAGSAPNGGVLVLAGDDHGAKSSTVAYQSEHDFIAAGMPVLYPANVQEYLEFGLHAIALSRFAGVWVAMKCVTEVVESSARVYINPDYPKINIPNIDLPTGGLNIRWPDTPLDQEARLLEHKLYAALEYISSNNLNKIVIDSDTASFGIMSAGKAYLDTRQALDLLGLNDSLCDELGIRLIKIGCVWPLNAQDARNFAQGLNEILVVEEKRQILEYALKEELYNWRDDVRPKIYGKFNQNDNQGGEWSVPRSDWLLPAKGELSPALIAKTIANILLSKPIPENIKDLILENLKKLQPKTNLSNINVVARTPWFCSGCPHNTSTNVPEGSRALAGIGCHYMTIWMDRKTETFSQMGGEGAAWIGQQHFTNEKHVFVNLGDGTYFHSGILAIRAAIAANANITYKILYNDAVAMTGGQPVDGILKVTDVVAQVHAEGAKKIVVVTDEPENYQGITLVGGTLVHHRSELDDIQRQLRETKGTTVLVYDQTCATEKRRRRKRGTYPDPDKRVFINDTVCEGCGDCSIKSNCLSVEPLETNLGTKRKINQSSCNKDFSCIDGFCPSFVTLHGAKLRKPDTKDLLKSLDLDSMFLQDAKLPNINGNYAIVVTGVGGTGVVTIGALLGMAAHIEHKGVNVLDMAGLAQKGGAVFSHIQIANSPADLHATRIALGQAKTIIGCDAIVTTSTDVLSLAAHDKTIAAINNANTPTADLIHNAKWKYPHEQTKDTIQNAIGKNSQFIDASALALKYCGDTIYANPLLLGYSWQIGAIPLNSDSIEQAIRLNNVMVEQNLLAFKLGRALALDKIPLDDPKTLNTTDTPKTALQKLITENKQWLNKYQNQAYANKYAKAIENIQLKEAEITGDKEYKLSTLAAKNLAKLMAYKDEYEVARLYTDPEFLSKLQKQFQGDLGKDYFLNFYLAPPLFSSKNSKGEPIKKKYGHKTLVLFKYLSKLKFLRNTPMDIFGKTHERKQERFLIKQYFDFLQTLEQKLHMENLETALTIAALPDSVRGYGHVKEKNIIAMQKQYNELIKTFAA